MIARNQQLENLILALIGLSCIGLIWWLFSYSLNLGFFGDDWGNVERAGQTPFRLGYSLQFLSPWSGDPYATFNLWWKVMWFTCKANPVPYHVVHIISHILTATTLYFALCRILKERWIALLGAFAFAVHKSTMESVQWSSGMTDGLVGFFLATSLYAYLRCESSKHQLKWILLSTLSFLLALKSKVAPITFPAILVAYEVFFNLPQRLKMESLKMFALAVTRKQAGIWAIALMYTIVYLSIYKLPKNNPAPGNYAADLSVHGYFSGLVWYLQASIFDLFRRTPPHQSFYWLSLFGAFIGLPALLKNRVMLFGTLWFAVSIFPVAVLVSHHFETHLYYPVVGLAIYTAGTAQALSSLAHTAFSQMKKVQHQIVHFLKPFKAIFVIASMAGILALNLTFFEIAKNVAQFSIEKTKTTLTSLREVYPTLPKNAHLFCLGRPILSLFDSDSAIRMIYGDETLKITVVDDIKEAHAAILGNSVSNGISPESANQYKFKAKDEVLVVFRYSPDTGKLSDLTDQFRSLPPSSWKL